MGLDVSVRPGFEAPQNHQHLVMAAHLGRDDRRIDEKRPQGWRYFPPTGLNIGRSPIGLGMPPPPLGLA
jgi:hypothetical protein